MDELNSKPFAPSEEPAINPILKEAESPQSPRLIRVLQEVKSWVRDVLFAIITAILIVVFVVQPVKVEGTSMLPRLVDQERIFVNRFIYHFADIQRGDIVVFWYPRDPSKSFIKRVIGLPSDIVRIDTGHVFVNGRQLSEIYVDPRYLDHESYGPERVSDNCYFVLGDHRNSSNDSRNWGQVPRSNIYGKAIFRYWPVSRLGSIE
jgi:signal peptidase I